MIRVAGYVPDVTSDGGSSQGERTVTAMHGTARQLEEAETILHRSAEESPNTDTTTRLHALGDQVTAQAHDIEQRADRLEPESDQRMPPTTAGSRPARP